MINTAEKNGTHHLVRRVKKSGMGIEVSTYCGETTEPEIHMLPDEFYPHLCDGCKSTYEEVRNQA